MTRNITGTASLLLALTIWQIGVEIFLIPPYILPSPLVIANELQIAFRELLWAAAFTLMITFSALTVSIFCGIGFALIFLRSHFLEASLSPFLVILQVTPIVAIAPLLMIWLDSAQAVMLISATLIAFFPIFAATLHGMRSLNPHWIELFSIYNASYFQRLFGLVLPGSLADILSGIRVGAGFALVGAVVAEFVAGTAVGQHGLAYQILEASYRLNIPHMFAALFMLGLCGVSLYALGKWLSHRMLSRWHESEFSSNTK